MSLELDLEVFRYYEMNVVTSLYACAQSYPTLCGPMAVAHQAPLSMGFPRQKYWSGLQFPTPGVSPNPGIEPKALVSPALIGKFFITEPPGSPTLHTAVFKMGNNKNLLYGTGNSLDIMW